LIAIKNKSTGRRMCVYVSTIANSVQLVNSGNNLYLSQNW
jgi:hypothetical protein